MNSAKMECKDRQRECKFYLWCASMCNANMVGSEDMYHNVMSYTRILSMCHSRCIWDSHSQRKRIWRLSTYTPIRDHMESNQKTYHHDKMEGKKRNTVPSCQTCGKSITNKDRLMQHRRGQAQRSQDSKEKEYSSWKMRRRSTTIRESWTMIQ